MHEDIAPTLQLPEGFDLHDYVQSILRRFSNPHIRYQLTQIAGDGSQKLPFRLFGALSDTLTSSRPTDRLCLPVAAWFHFIRRRAQRGERAVDPLATKLFDIGLACTGRAWHDVQLFLALDTVFSTDLRSNTQLAIVLAQAYEQLSAVTDSTELAAVIG
jgi:fructuronate reductase